MVGSDYIILKVDGSLYSLGVLDWKYSSGYQWEYTIVSSLPWKHFQRIYMGL